MVDEVDVRYPFYTLQRHFKSLNRIDGLQRGADAPAYDFLGIGIQDERQVAEDIMPIIQPDGDVCDIAYP